MNAAHKDMHARQAQARDNASWQDQIDIAISTADPILANLRITAAHYQLSLALRRLLGPGTEANGRSLLDGFEGQAVDDDLINAFDFGWKLGRQQSSKCRREGGVGAGSKGLVFAADLRPRPGDPSRERQDHARNTSRIARSAAARTSFTLRLMTRATCGCGR